MNLQYWLNFKDYSNFQLSIALIGSVLWVMAYFFLIKDTIRNKYIEMPFFIACGNFAWEILYAYVFDEYINLGQVYVWGYRAWFFMDILIFILLLRYGKKQTDNLWLTYNFKILNVTLLVFYTLFFYAWILEGFDNTPIHGDGSIKLGATSAYLLNFGISLSYIAHFFKRKNAYRFSKPVAWCKGTGTALFTILFWQIDPENYLVQTLGVLIFAGDSFYIYLLYLYQPSVKETKINLSNLTFQQNEKFEKLWQQNPAYISVKNVRIRYYQKDEWTYKSPNGKYETTIGVAEGNILIEHAKGEVEVEDVKAGLKLGEDIVKEIGLENKDYYYIADSTQITKVSLKSRDIVINFHEKTKNLKQFVSITNAFTRVLLKIMTPVNPDVINNWLLADSVENGLYELFKSWNNASQKNPPIYSFAEKRINEACDVISKISLRKFDAIDSPKLSEKDPFHGIFTALEILKNDKQETLQEMDLLLNHSYEALKEQEAHFKHLFENSYEVIFVIDNHDILVNFNQGAKEISKARGNDLKTGYSIYNFLSPKYADLYNELKKDLQIGNKRDIEFKLENTNGKTIWFHCKCHPIQLSETKVYYVFLMDNITQEKQLQQEKQQMNQTLLFQNQKLNEFSYILYNDLRQQAVTMANVIENLKKSLQFTSVNVNKVTVLRKALDDMDQVISDLDKVLNENKSTDLKQNESDNNNLLE